MIQNNPSTQKEGDTYVSYFNNKEYFEALEQQGYEIEKQKQTEQNTSFAAQAGGVNKVEFRWYGLDLYINRDVAQSVINVGSTAGGSAIGAAVGNVPGAAAGAAGGQIISEFSSHTLPADGVIVPISYLPTPTVTYVSEGARSQ